MTFRVFILGEASIKLLTEKKGTDESVPDTAGTVPGKILTRAFREHDHMLTANKQDKQCTYNVEMRSRKHCCHGKR
jgi:hypothetical protein